MKTRSGVLIFLILALATMTGCNSKGWADEKLPGLSHLDTISEEDREEEAWFKSFYGSRHCGVWAGSCKPGEDEETGGGGGFWGGGVGPSDGSSASHSD